MSRPTLMNSPFLLGFDDIEKALERVTRTASDGYPPYNIERLAGEGAVPERLASPSPSRGLRAINCPLRSKRGNW